jgi:hypothetical protein
VTFVEQSVVFIQTRVVLEHIQVFDVIVFDELILAEAVDKLFKVSVNVLAVLIVVLAAQLLVLIGSSFVFDQLVGVLCQLAQNLLFIQNEPIHENVLGLRGRGRGRVGLGRLIYRVEELEQAVAVLCGVFFHVMLTCVVEFVKISLHCSLSEKKYQFLFKNKFDFFLK